MTIDTHLKQGDNLKNSEVVTEEKEKIKGKSIAYKVIIIILFAGLFYGGYYIWNGLGNAKIAIEKLASDASAGLEHTNSTISKLEASIDRLAADQKSISDSLERLYKQQPGSNEDWALAEVEYLLIIAAQRLLLEQDIKTALSAMQAADLRLKDIGNPQLIPVREQLATDMNQLRSVAVVDVSGLAIYLADLSSRSNTLPLKGNSIAIGHHQSKGKNEIDQGTSWRDFPMLAWQELKTLLVIKRSDEAGQALLLADEEYFLYQNLRLELENARLSVLLRDTDNLRASINLIKTWLMQYFDISDTSVVNVMETLEQMSTIDLGPDLPDISSSLESLRAYIRTSENEVDSNDKVNEIPIL